MKDYLTLPEINKKYPTLPFNNWDIGRLVKMGLIDGRQVGRSCIVKESSLKEIVKFKDKVYK